MFDPAALSLTSALNPAMNSGAIAANAVMLDNAGTPGEVAETAQNGGFEALLALQSALAQMTLPANRPLAQTADKAGVPAIAQQVAQLLAQLVAEPATGKILPDAAMPLAAFAGELAGMPDDQSAPDDTHALAFMADPAVLASIFAAPDRLADAPVNSAQAGRSTPMTTGAGLVPQAAQITPNPAKPEPAANAAAIALAQAAVIELDPDTKPVLPQDAAASSAPLADVAARLQARPASTARAASGTQDPAIAPPVAPAPSEAFEDLAEQAALPEMPEDVASPVIARTDDAAPVPDAAPAGRAGARAERVDFATLVETLNRAREEASPGTVRVSLAHADFGRVSMRFEQDDKGMSVAMGSADPGFARAVTASNEAASTATSSDNSRGQSSQANTGSSTQGESNRQPQGQRADTPERPAAQLRDTLRRKEEPGTPGGIFA